MLGSKKTKEKETDKQYCSVLKGAGYRNTEIYLEAKL